MISTEKNEVTSGSLIWLFAIFNERSLEFGASDTEPKIYFILSTKNMRLYQATHLRYPRKYQETIASFVEDCRSSRRRRKL
ncbi:hypothetical protein PENTCL1PPCAC_21105, partial [Pristionchus entomophagus]